MPRSANPLPFPARPGTYVLVFDLPQPLALRAGALGAVTLPAGPALYVGSARGPGGLRARLGRHLRAEKKPHWHVDALTTIARIVEVWWDDSGERLECAWASVLRGAAGAGAPAPGFGASDCTCATHLFALPAGSLPAAWVALGRPHRAEIPEAFSRP